MVYTITPGKNLVAKLSHPLPEQLERALQKKFVWVNPVDFKDKIELYKDQRMYVGLMQAVRAEVNEYGLQCQIQLPELSKQDFECESYITYRALQEDFANDIMQARFGFGVASPGVGKTKVLSQIVSILKRKTVIITEAEEPFYGAYETIKESTNIDVGRVGCGFHEPRDVTVCMVATTRRRIKELDKYPELERLFNEAKVWITDEAHNCLSDGYGMLYDLAKNAEFFIGMSATPFTSSEKESILYARVGPILHEITYGQAVENNLLVPFTGYVEQGPVVDFGYNKVDPETNEPIRYPSYIRNRQYASARKRYIINNEKRNRMYVDFAKDMMEYGKSCAIIVAEVEHGANFKNLYPDLVEVYGTTPKKQRKEAWAKLRRKEIMGVVTTLMDEATDIPSLDAVAIAAGGKSKVKLIQRLRNLRTFEGETVNGWEKKERGYVYITQDNADFVKTHSKTNIANLKTLAKQHPDCEVIDV